MNAQEIAAIIIQRWRLEHTVDAIMVGLIRAGHPITRASILRVIKTYVNSCSENRTYRAKA
jgi:hypothetical protein